MQPIKAGSKYLDILQIFRGIAALMVVVHHSVNSLKYYHHIDNEVLLFIGAMGKFGVDFFFVLSGFIISYSSDFKYSEPKALKHFAINRMLRIYIPYLPVGIFMLCIYSFYPSFSNGSRDISLLTSMTLIPSGSPALSVAWTLSFEIIFYFLFSLSFFSRKVWLYFLFFWVGSILSYNYFFPNLKLFQINSIFKFFFNTYNLEFLIGYFLSKLIIKEIKLNYRICLTSILLLLGAFLSCAYYKLICFPFYLNLLFSISTFFIIYFAITYYNLSISKKSIFMMIGNATFSIYLIHNPLQMVIIRLFPKVTSIVSSTFVILLVIFASCLLGYLYFAFFEKYLMNKIKHKLINKT